MRTRIKFCGCTSVRDAQLAVDSGVDAVGVIFARESPRFVPLERAAQIARAVPPFVSLIAVFVDPAGPDVAAARGAGYVPQFSGAESAQACEAIGGDRYIKVHHMQPTAAVVPNMADDYRLSARDYRHALWLFDTTVDGKHGGTGRTFDWTVARALAGDGTPMMISGGLRPDNVAACVRAVRPYAVDVRSGIETNGVKDESKMRAFVRAVKEADEQS